MLKILAKSVQFLSERLSVKRKMEAVNFYKHKLLVLTKYGHEMI